MLKFSISDDKNARKETCNATIEKTERERDRLRERGRERKKKKEIERRMREKA